MNISEKTRKFIIISLVVVAIGIIGFNFIATHPKQEIIPAANSTSLTTCYGKEMPFDEKNASDWSGVVKCDNGTMIKALYLKFDNGKLQYSGLKK